MDTNGIAVTLPSRPADLDARRAALEEALTRRILVLDGATGTDRKSVV